MSAYTDLMAHVRETLALAAIHRRQTWDQEAMMPRGAGPQRAEENAALEAVLHGRRTDGRVGEWLARAEAEETGLVERAQLRHIRRTYDRETKIPEALARALAARTSLAQGVWAEARAADDFRAFAPVLEEIVGLKREQATALADGGDAYDALLQEFEPGASWPGIAAIFDAMRPRLVALRERCLGAPAPAGLRGAFDADAQMEIARDLAVRFGYDLNHGRIDRVVHPFMSGGGLDVRITTRTVEDDPFNCFYSTIHEVGHAAYEQAISRDHLLTPLGRGASMSVHESQSRFYENQLGRSRAFTGWLFGRMGQSFSAFGPETAEDFYRCANAVRPGHIRTEADEVQYNLHIFLRFDLERALIGGALDVADLEAAWNERFAADFGYPVDRASNGVLQDVHWSIGYFGYFPTYALGNVYAGCLHEAMRAAVPDHEAALAEGRGGPALDWLRENVQVHGGLYEPRETIERATGKAPSEGPLLDYLEAKFGEIYAEQARVSAHPPRT